MKEKKNIGGLIALSAGLALLLIGGIIGIVKLINRDKDDPMDDPMIADDLEQKMSSGGAAYNNMGYSTEQVKAMQTYLLQLGFQHNNQYIIDAIQLTGGIDGIMGDGFKAAVIEARDKGYLTGFEDLLQKLGY